MPGAALEQVVDSIAASTGFCGAVRVDRYGELELAKAYGMAHRAYAIPNTIDTRFGLASGTKGLTAIAVATLIEDGTLALETPARSLLGSDLPLIGHDVTVEHLLSHRSGIGDYLDEETGLDVSDYVLPVSAHELATTERYLAVLDGHVAKFAPGTRFAYCNSGFVVLALIAERASGIPFHDLVRRRVCEPAGMHATSFLRSDGLPRDAAIGYLEIDGVMRSNVFHLPVRGTGDGGIYSTVADISAFWAALFGGALVAADLVVELMRPRSVALEASRRYGLGFWLHEVREVSMLEGMDAGVSFSSAHDPLCEITYTVISNTSEGAWPVAAELEQHLLAGVHP